MLNVSHFRDQLLVMGRLVTVAESELLRSQPRSRLFCRAAVFSLPAFVCRLFSLFCLSLREMGGWWVMVCCPQYVVMEDLVLQKERPPGQTGTIIDLFGIRRLHSSECWSGCWWIHRESGSVHTAADSTLSAQRAQIWCLSAQCELQKAAPSGYVMST